MKSPTPTDCQRGNLRSDLMPDTEAVGDRRPPPWTLDQLVLACDLVVNNSEPTGSAIEWRALTANDPRVIKLSALLRRLPIHPRNIRGAKFRNPNGVARKTVDLATHHPAYTGGRTKGGRLDQVVIQQFIEDPQAMANQAAAIRSAAQIDVIEEALLDLDLDTNAEADEGRVLLRLHLMRERNPRLRAKKINDARKRLGYVRCEVCSFDFERVYGVHGRDYIECHHRKSLSHTGQTTTSLADLALLCSNCHRMIHRIRPWLTVDELSGLVQQ